MSQAKEVDEAEGEKCLMSKVLLSYITTLCLGPENVERLFPSRPESTQTLQAPGGKGLPFARPYRGQKHDEVRVP